MRIAVTGASGFIGSWIVRSLLSRGHEVVAYLRTESDTWRLPKHENLCLVKMDEYGERIDLAERKIESLIIAGWFGVEQIERDSNRQFDNLILFRNLLRAAEIGKVLTVIGIGSQAEYGETTVLIDEESAVTPKSNYAKAKVQASEILFEFGGRTGARVTWIRIFSVLGPLMPPVGFVPELVSSKSIEEKIELKNPNLVWSFLDVKTYKNGKTYYPLTLFLGLYNAEKYLAGLKVQITRQKSNSFNLLIVDNASTDSTWLQLENFISDIDVPITLVKNPLNLGSTGSQVLNFDLLNSEWFAFIHQDDYYSPNHVKTLAKEIDNAHEDVIAISTLMGSKLPNGKKGSDPPRAIWLVPSNDPQTTFLANVRQHTVPWPSTAFRTKPFIECLPPWHGTAFPDSEIILKLCAKGKFNQIEKVTMSYTENPDSESHSINDVERVIGATASLARIFTSPEFIEISKGVPQDNRKEFSEALQNAITARIGNGPLNEMLWLIANETLLVAWEYSNSINLSNTSELYSQIGAERPSNLLDALINSGFVNNAEVAKSPDLKFEASLLPGIIQKKPKSDSLALPSALQRVVNLCLKILPHNIERMLVTKLIQLKVKSNPIHPWNFRWR